MTHLTLNSAVTGEPMTRLEFLKNQGLLGCKEGSQEQLQLLKGYKLVKEGYSYWVPDCFVDQDTQTMVVPEDATVRLIHTEPKTYSPSSLDKVKAHPMDLEVYNALRGWSTTSGQDPLTQGYVVEDPCCAKNHELFDDGITWMSKADFEAKYHLSENHIDRLQHEQTELRTRSIALSGFLDKINNREVEIRPLQRDLMCVQLQLQKRLDATLINRINWSEPCDAMEYKDFPVPAIVKNLDHGTAMLFCGLGYPILRQGWNGKQQYVFLAEPHELSTTDETENKALCKLNSFTCITSEQGPTCAWVASPTDIQATDWVVLFKI